MGKLLAGDILRGMENETYIINTDMIQTTIEATSADEKRKNKIMKVFVVTSGEYSDYSVDGIFSTREKAEKYIEKRKASQTYWTDANQVIEWEVDAQSKEKAYTRYFADLNLETGELLRPQTSVAMFGIPESNSGCGHDQAFAFSHKSSEHALKLAIEARQKWLREKGNA